mmetsp:Transcript_8795/g.21976  ORF Transcript_8795/g.21976 Transcript_8795/m.21976 type:complete len:132 (-) Transcript_8795:323-718(-)
MASMGLGELHDALPVVLDFSPRGAEITGSECLAMAAAQPTTNIVRLDGCSQVDVDTLSALQGVLEGLADLSLAGCNHLDQGKLCHALSSGFPALKSLDVRGCTQLSDRDLATILVRRTMCGMQAFRYTTTC